jgi:hypothetical protein
MIQHKQDLKEAEDTGKTEQIAGRTLSLEKSSAAAAEAKDAFNWAQQELTNSNSANRTTIQMLFRNRCVLNTHATVVYKQFSQGGHMFWATGYADWLQKLRTQNVSHVPLYYYEPQL